MSGGWFGHKLVVPVKYAQVSVSRRPMSLRPDLGRREDGGIRLDEGGSTLTEHAVGAWPARTTLVFSRLPRPLGWSPSTGCVGWMRGLAPISGGFQVVPRRLGGDDGRDDAAVHSAGGRSRRPCVSGSADSDLWRCRYLAVWTAFGVVAYAVSCCDVSRPGSARLGPGRALRRGCGDRSGRHPTS